VRSKKGQSLTNNFKDTCLNPQFSYLFACVAVFKLYKSQATELIRTLLEKSRGDIMRALVSILLFATLLALTAANQVHFLQGFFLQILLFAS
jgi:hypothetical protein